MKRRTNHQVLWILLLTWTLTILPSLPILAQTTTATMSGTIKDESGALLPGVTVVATNLGTGGTRTAVTDDEGRYTMPELPPGSYEMQAELAGFRTAVHTGINLTIGRHAIME